MIGFALAEPVCYAAEDWQGPNTGERGGTFWVNRKTGERAYQADNPGGAGASGGVEATSPEKHVEGWAVFAARLPKKAMQTAARAVQGKYEKLKARYGKKAAMAIMAAGIAGLPLPVPGSSLITAAPVIALAEAYRYLTGGPQQQQPQPPQPPQQFALDSLDTLDARNGQDAGDVNIELSPDEIKRLGKELIAELMHAGESLRYSAEDWQGPNHGDRGGVYWVNRKTQEKVYQQENPGGQPGQGGEQPQQPQAAQQPSAAMQATAQSYAEKAKQQFGDQAHAKLSAMAQQLANDQTPEGQRKLAAVNAMLQSLGPQQPQAGQSQPAAAPAAPAAAQTASDLDDDEPATTGRPDGETRDAMYERHKKEKDELFSRHKPEEDQFRSSHGDKTEAERQDLYRQLKDRQKKEYGDLMERHDAEIEEEAEPWLDDDGEDIREKWEGPESAVAELNSYSHKPEDVAKMNEELERVGSDFRVYQNPDGMNIYALGSKQRKLVEGLGDTSGISSIALANKKLEAEGDVRVSLGSMGQPTLYDSSSEKDELLQENLDKLLPNMKSIRSDFTPINDRLAEDGFDERVYFDRGDNTPKIDYSGASLQAIEAVNRLAINRQGDWGNAWRENKDMNEGFSVASKGGWSAYPIADDDLANEVEEASYPSAIGGVTSGVNDLPAGERDEAAAYYNDLLEQAGDRVRLVPGLTSGEWDSIETAWLSDPRDASEWLADNYGPENFGDAATWFNGVLDDQADTDERLFAGVDPTDGEAQLYTLSGDDYERLSAVKTEDDAKELNRELRDEGESYRVAWKNGKIGIIEDESQFNDESVEEEDAEDEDDDE